MSKVCVLRGVFLHPAQSQHKADDREQREDAINQAQIVPEPDGNRCAAQESQQSRDDQRRTARAEKAGYGKHRATTHVLPAAYLIAPDSHRPQPDRFVARSRLLPRLCHSLSLSNSV